MTDILLLRGRGDGRLAAKGVRYTICGFSSLILLWRDMAPGEFLLVGTVIGMVQCSDILDLEAITRYRRIRDSDH